METLWFLGSVSFSSFVVVFVGGPQSPNGSPPLSSSRSFRAHKKAAVRKLN